MDGGLMRAFLFGGLLLAACVPADADQAQIRFGNSGSITGPGIITTVAADDSATVTINDWSGQESGNTQSYAIVPGSFARVQALLAAEGAAVQAALDPGVAACQDFGTDFIEAEPPVAGIGRLSAGCPEAPLYGLINRLSAAIAAP
jgi:hypothetical protein